MLDQTLSSEIKSSEAKSSQIKSSDISNPKEQWRDVNSILNTWLAERQELIRLLCLLTNKQPHKSDFLRSLENFCEVLVDYLSAGHFEVFAELESEARSFDSRGINLVNALYPYLEQSTQIALGFNDRCNQLKNSSSLHEEIKTELSFLGEALTDRFELEDQLVEYVHKSNAALLQE